MSVFFFLKKRITARLTTIDMTLTTLNSDEYVMITSLTIAKIWNTKRSKDDANG